jgi:thiol:disulfide interchange protein DsbC
LLESANYRTEYLTVKTSWLLTLLSLALPLAYAQEAAAPSRADVAASLKGIGLSIEAANLHESAMDGFFEIRLGAKVGYVSADGRFLFEGELYDLQAGRNLTDSSRAEARVQLLAGVDPERTIVFSPQDGPVRYAITVFTDVDCGYCRQFPREIDQVLARGIEVHYLFYPRTGPATESWDKAERVWCASDRHTALTNAKLGGQVPEATCDDNPVQAHYDLGHQLGVTGTPTIYAPDGTHIGGYMPPDELLETLNRLAD